MPGVVIAHVYPFLPVNTLNCKNAGGGHCARVSVLLVEPLLQLGLSLLLVKLHPEPVINQTIKQSTNQRSIVNNHNHNGQ